MYVHVSICVVVYDVVSFVVHVASDPTIVEGRQ